MQLMFESRLLWSIATILGPVLLFAAMICGLLVHNFKRGIAKRHAANAGAALYRAGHEGMESKMESPSLVPDIAPMNEHSSCHELNALVRRIRNARL